MCGFEFCVWHLLIDIMKFQFRFLPDYQPFFSMDDYTCGSVSFLQLIYRGVFSELRIIWEYCTHDVAQRAYRAACNNRKSEPWQKDDPEVLYQEESWKLCAPYTETLNRWPTPHFKTYHESTGYTHTHARARARAHTHTHPRGTAWSCIPSIPY